MGQAKAKKAKRAKFLKENPWCCYRGGGEPTTTLDHDPSIQKFPHRRRPKGLEVPACKPCNNATGPHEQVAMLGRLYPDPPRAEMDEVSSVMHKAFVQNSGFHEEMRPSRRQDARFRSKNDDPKLHTPGR